MTEYIIIGTVILFDIITGVIKAGYQGNIDSTKMRQGLYHKLSEVVSVVGCGLLQLALRHYEFPIDIHIVQIVAGYVTLTEIISVIENIAEVNPKLGGFLTKYFKKIVDNNKTDSGGNDDELSEKGN